MVRTLGAQMRNVDFVETALLVRRTSLLFGIQLPTLVYRATKPYQGEVVQISST
jgi:hypothetical protein